MKDIKKHQGTKTRVRAYKKRLAYISATISATIIIVIIATSIFLISHP